ncbi:carboxymuconolactone decarboxylase family protein [Neomoorella humiferrea]|uniref:Carboxymuconolactone decarboxylase family protein n=1 Tax=Neomoorella humiferrea TaxID=676965 RepID=A0A2T0AJX9_9FIRM|nr:carboxymuconolactone decarboxylase family protein [Moorella humiferrea]PRR68714.1 Carboxymuconolactone decarboxylase family protein [Moorella humiferrea]
MAEELNRAQRILKDFQDGLERAKVAMPKTIQAYMDLEKYAAANYGVFDNKTKELMMLAQGVRTPCKYCIVIHTYNAIQEGATKEEIYEAASVAIPFGGAKTFAYACTYLTEAVEAFWVD